MHQTPVCNFALGQTSRSIVKAFRTHVNSLAHVLRHVFVYYFIL